MGSKIIKEENSAVTIEELSGLHYINKEIQLLSLELEELKQKNFYGKNIISDMPRGGHGEEKNVEYVNAVLLVEDLLNYSLKKLQKERGRVEKFLISIEDAEMRLIMRLRAVNNMKWEEIGQEVGMERTTVSKKFYKYFQKL